MSEFLEWFIPRACVFALLVALVVLSFWLSSWSFDECLRVGHTRSYCTVKYWLGAHGE